MRLRYGFLCEYAAELANRTNMVVGIFDRMNIQRPIGAPVVVVPHVIFVAVEDSAVSPPRHLIEFKLVDADGTAVHVAEMPFTIGSALAVPEPGTPKAGNVTVRLQNPIAVADVGAFEWVVSVDGERIGSIPFTISETEAGAVSSF